MSSQSTKMSQTDSAGSVCVNVEEEKSDSPGGVESQTETKGDLRVVITINPTETATTTTAASQTDNNTTQTGKDQTDSMTSGSTDSVDSGDSGVVNQAYVEDETEQSSDSGKVSRKKGHQRSPSYSPNKDDESITAVNGEEGKELDTNPPILSDVTEKNKEAELYSEYFMPVNEFKPSIGDYKKRKAGPSSVKILCWVLSLFLLAGAIVLAVLIGTGIIDTDPTRTIKVSRNLEPSRVGGREGGRGGDLSASVDLIEVNKTDLPNVRTNLPEFFTSKGEHFNGELRLDNVDWTPDLADQNSYQFKQLAGMLEEGINDVLRAQFENFTFHTTVKTFSEGSLIVKFDITVTNNLNDKDNDFIGKAEIAKALISNINQDYGFLFGKFSSANNSVIIEARFEEEGSQQPENTDGHSIEKNMQSDGTMRTTEKYLTNKHSVQSIAQTHGVKLTTTTTTTTTTATTTTVSQIPEDWENIKDMEISSEFKIDSIKEDEKQMVDTEPELVITEAEELPETGTERENIEMATDIPSPQFKSVKLEADFGSGEEDSTERVLSLELN